MAHFVLRSMVVAALVVWLPALAGCVHVDPGGTVLNVRVDDPDEDRAVRLQMWRVERAIEIVRVEYGLEDIAVEVIVTDIGGLGETMPGLDDSLHVEAAIVTLNKSLFIEEHPDLDAILLGLLAHEMAHGLHYARMSRADTIELGVNYDQFMKHPAPDTQLESWIRAYEQYTDMTTIAHGYGEQLVHQKRASEENLAIHHPPKVWDFYLHEDEIRELMADPELLVARANEHLDTLNLPSLESMREHPRFVQLERLAQVLATLEERSRRLADAGS
jgi:hypothetical protein